MNILLYYPGIDLDLSIASSTHVKGVINKLNYNKYKYLTIVNKVDKYIPNAFRLVKVGFNSYIPFETAISEICSFFIVFIKKLEFDIIYQRETILGTGLLLKLILDKKLVTEVNGIIIDELTETVDKKKRIFSRPLIFLNKLQIRKSDIVIAVSDDVKKKIMQYYNIPSKNIRVIENGVDIDVFKPMEMAECQKKLKLTLGYVYVIYVGSLEYWQRVDKLLDVMELIKSKRTDVKMLIVGDGPEMNKLKYMAEDKKISDVISFMGRIEHEKIPLYINASSICVAPFKSSRSASPLKLFEYMACGKAVIGHNICFPCTNGIILDVDVSQPTIFADKIEYLLDNQNIRCELAHKGLNYVVNNSTWSMVAQKIENIFEEVYNSEK
jgi:glycosyltransferase involved in cell wall biosynthesis